jgi:hypothetical protein
LNKSFLIIRKGISMINRSMIITGFSVVLSTLGLSAIANLPASAQTSTGVEPFVLSNEGFEILCDRSPLNSRCAGVTPTSNQRTPDENTPSDTTTAPTENLPSESDVPETGGRESLDPNLIRPRVNESRNEMNNNEPSNTTAPTENLPSESDVPSPDVRNDQMSPGMSPSSGDMNTPSNTTAPTQNLPSESDTPSAP